MKIKTYRNKHDERLYLVSIKEPSINIVYVPKNKCVDTASLSQYIWDIKVKGDLQLKTTEYVCNKIANSLLKILQPYYLSVHGQFYGENSVVKIDVIAERWNLNEDDKCQDLIEHMLNTYLK